jgi:signal transduction histidine kinase
MPLKYGASTRLALEIVIMIYNIDPEYFTLIFTILGTIGTFFSLVWVKVIRPILKLINGHEGTIKTISEIKAELTTNGGNSIKDAIIDLRKTCHRIESHQRIIEQRTKATLHYSDIPLFETDKYGRLIWSNVHLCKFLNSNTSHLEGYDWLSIIKEEDREEVLSEFKSCLNMNRKFTKQTHTINDKNIRMLGYPYKINESEHGGFLVSILEENEV